MKLVISDKEVELTLGEVSMSISEFCSILNHPYIVSQDFDCIVVDLDSSIPSGYLSAMIGRTKVIPRINGDITTDIVRLVAELYPEHAAELRFAFIRNKEKLPEIINKLKDDFQWKDFY